MNLYVQRKQPDLLQTDFPEQPVLTCVKFSFLNKIEWVNPLFCFFVFYRVYHGNL